MALAREEGGWCVPSVLTGQSDSSSSSSRRGKMRPQNLQPCWLISNMPNAANLEAIKANKTIKSNRLEIKGQDCKYSGDFFFLPLFFLWVFAFDFKHHFILSLYLFYTILFIAE